MYSAAKSGARIWPERTATGPTLERGGEGVYLTSEGVNEETGEARRVAVPGYGG
jgi:hypothetical protein